MGEPIDVKKVTEPTNEEIEKLYQLFISRLVKLFEGQKSKYIENFDEVHLEIL